MLENIRNFCILAHIDHGKSTLADRFLEITGTIEPRQMKAQFLDSLELERERGITIKMAPVRMIYHSDRRLTQNERGITQNSSEFLYEDLTFKIRGAVFEARKKLGLGHKEQVYHSALEIEFKKAGLNFESKKNIPIFYEGKNIGIYQPDFIVDDKVLIELKSLPEIGRSQVEQLWAYLKGCEYKLALLINFGSKDLEIKRVIYDSARSVDSDLRNFASSQRDSAQVEYILNLIDTPGHPDFSYEVSRAFKAVEGGILLVDATQGIQAQTLAHFEVAKKEGLKIIGAVNKIDLNPVQLDSVIKETAELIGCDPNEIFKVSGKTGEGAEELLNAVIKEIPPPRNNAEQTQNNAEIPRSSASSPRISAADVKSALIFDSLYDDHKGVIANVRVFSGEFSGGQDLKLIAANEKIKIKEVGYFSPALKTASKLTAGEIGYIATGIKDPGKLQIGDTIGDKALTGYEEPRPRVFVSFFPEDGSKYEELKKSFQKLRLNDPAIKLEPDSNEVLGRGFKAGFLGKLHFEITSQRLEKEFNVETVNSFPSVSYRIRRGKTRIETPNDAEKIQRKSTSSQRELAFEIIDSPKDLPNDFAEIWEPMIDIEILIAPAYLGNVLKLAEPFRMENVQTKTLGERIFISAKMPLMELISDFDDQLKSVSHGFASFGYLTADYQKGDLVRLDVLVAKNPVVGLSRIIPKINSEYEARKMAKKLKEFLPRQQFEQAIQVVIGTRVIARETIPALRKDVTGYLYGGDRTRKMKLWKKQKKGKKKLLKMAKVGISAEVFKELLKKE